MGTTAIYAIGGTGAKLLESLVHLCAAGMSSETLMLRLVDQDKSNGNMQRVRTLIGDYRKVRAWLCVRNPPGHDPRPLFDADIDLTDEVMSVVPEPSETLASAFGLNERAGLSLEPSDLLMQALFSAKERTGRMENGFRGQPAVGAAVFLSKKSRDGSPLWTQLADDVARAHRGDIHQFLLLGSSFGGCGAAGVPTLGDYLRQALRGATPSVRVAAVLMLRYYGVRGISEYGPAAPARTKAAMEFYHQVMKVENGATGVRLFERLYLVGLHPELAVPAEPVGGGRGQINPALMPELVGALGGIHFLERLDLSQNLQEKPVFLCGHAGSGGITWSDLPRASLPGQPDARRRLGSFARFALCYAYGIHPAEFLSKVPYALDQPMYLALLNAKHLKAGAYDEQAKSLNTFVHKFLRWMGALHGSTKDQQLRPGSTAVTLSLGPFADLVVDTPDAPDKVELKYDPAVPAGVKTDTLETVFDAIGKNVADAIGVDGAASSLAEALGRLAAAPGVTVRNRSLGRFVSAAYAATTVSERGG